MRLMCDSCEFFDETHHLSDERDGEGGVNLGEPVAGYCRRYAPVPPGTTQKLDYTEPNNPHRAMWPIVASGDWCGEFVKRAEA